MAIYHLSVKPVSRKKGRTATASSAYRAGEKIEDKRTGEIHDYTKKQGVEYTQIFTPNGVDIPSRQELWNMAEMAEKRKDACVAREYEVNLPYELSKSQRIELAQDFSKQLSEKHGIAVDLCMHEPDTKNGGDDRNYHAHILTTTRKITNEGLTEKADIEKAGRKRKQDLKNVRQLWADTANRHLEKAGLEERIDHRSLKEQGSQLKPTIKMGKTATQMERQGKPTIKGDINRAITADNEQIKSLSMDIYLDKGRLSALNKKDQMKQDKEEQLKQEIEERRAKAREVEKDKQAKPNERPLTLAEKRELWKQKQAEKNKPEPVAEVQQQPEPKHEPEPPRPSRGLSR